MGSHTKAILVPVDFTEAARHATENAIELGEQLNSDVYLVNFIPPLKKRTSGKEANVDEISDQLVSSMNLLKENERKLAQMLKGIDDSNVLIHSEIKMDKLAAGIKKQLKKKDIGLIVIGITGAKTVGDSFCRTRNVKDLIEVECPIMICSNHNRHMRDKNTMVISLDFDSLDEQNVENLAEIARGLTSEIYYIHVNHPSDKKKCTKRDIEIYLRKHRLKADAIVVLDSDNKEQAIRNYADEKSADFIAISRFSKFSNYEACHSDEVAEQTDNPVFVY